MRSCYCNTPYILNLKLKSLNQYPLIKNSDINTLYKNLKASIPALTNQFCVLKRRTDEINNSLNKIKLVTDNYETSRSFYNSLPKNSKFSPNILNTNNNYYYNFSYLSPKPVLKSFQNYNIQRRNNTFNYKNNTKNNNYKTHLNFDYDYDLNIPNKKYNNRNYSAKYITREKNNNINNYNLYSPINNNSDKKNGINKEEYEKKLKKLNEKIYEKDILINKMEGIIDDTFNKLNIRKKNNYLAKSEVLNLKNNNDFMINDKLNKFKNNNIYGNIRYKNDNNYEINNKINNDKNNRIYVNKRYNNDVNERIQKNKYKRKKFNSNDIPNNNYNNGYNEDFYNNKTSEDNMDLKWDEIRKLNKKMNNLLDKNKNN